MSHFVSIVCKDAYNTNFELIFKQDKTCWSS